jgi:hypothetical protein
MPAKISQIFVRPSRPYFAIETRFGLMVVPAKAKPIAVGARGGF